MAEITNEPQSHALATQLEDSFFATRRLRKDGWNGPRISAFIGTLAETGLVTFACRAADMSAQSAYGLRHRNPIFARAWEAALSIARHRLADELLARSLKGSAEAILRDGAIVAERQHFDNKLAFSILRRLDHQAELGSTFRVSPAREIRTPALAVHGHWQDLLDALSEDRAEEADELLSAKVDSKVDDPPFSLDCEGDEGDDGTPARLERVWQEWRTDEWRTDFPPPPGFDGDERGSWEDPAGYSRSLTDEELSALVTAGKIEPEPQPILWDDDVAERDAYFAALRGAAQASEPESASLRTQETHPEPAAG